VHVNLWELITTVASKKDSSNSAECQAIKNYIGPRFGTEYSLEINELTGVQTLCVFNHEDHDVNVTLAIQPNGSLTVTRSRYSEDIFETRKVSF
jgi:hypothetical protein